MLQLFASYGPSFKRQQRNKYIWDLKDHFARKDGKSFKTNIFSSREGLQKGPLLPFFN